MDIYRSLEGQQSVHECSLKFGGSADPPLPLNASASECRNSLIFEKQIVEPMEALRLVQQQWLEIDESRGEHKMRWNEPRRQAERVEKHPTCWAQPPFRTIKVNCVGAWVNETGKGGYSWVASDFAGIFKGAGGLGNILCESNLMADAETIRDVMMACVE